MGHMTDPRAKALHSDEKYDAKEAYNKDLTASARLHYLENNVHDHSSPTHKAASAGRGGHPSHMQPGAENAGKASGDEYWRVHQQLRHHQSAPKTEASGAPSKMLASGKVKFPVHHRGGKELGSAELKYMPIMDHGAATKMDKGAAAYQMEEKGSAAYKYPGAPTHQQGYNDRLDDALGSKHGHSNNQSLTDRRHESEGMEEHYGKNKFTGDKKMS